MSLTHQINSSGFFLIFKYINYFTILFRHALFKYISCCVFFHMLCFYYHFSCWLRTDNYFILSFVIPAAIVVLVSIYKIFISLKTLNPYPAGTKTDYLSIISFRDIKMRTWSLWANSIGPEKTAQKCRLAWLYTGGNGLSLLVTAG